ncbi:hypothetical protein PHJA_000948600 [Phtheirospermum japonicum]|uniref:Uncharacterized protein n=1 Tax=Phtheirospermum japonicum TaxID=374723 RepID=A0A830BQI4_9LAMI|nr:hypothetical protein PHJA_000948600 [Phtheirospermum japonicum]
MGCLPRFSSSPLCVLFVRRWFFRTPSLLKSSNTLGICSFWCWSGNWFCVHRVLLEI